MAPTIDDVRTWRGHDVMGPDGEKVGTLENVYVDRQTGEPTFAAVKTGLFGMKESLVPIDGASLSGGSVQVQYGKELIKDAPHVDADQELSPAEEERLYAHYGRSYGAADTTATTGTENLHGTAGHDTSGPTTDSAMTRSEEELRVGKAETTAGTARLRKWVETENVTETVPVERERAVVEREPITDANVEKAYDGPAISSEEHEVTLRAEEAVVEKRAVPKERVRLETETEVEDVTVSEELRKERIEAEGDIVDRPGDGLR